MKQNFTHGNWLPSAAIYFSDSKEFTIDKDTGLIVVAEEVDREERSSYLLNITVIDHAANPLSASTFLEIILDDGLFPPYQQYLYHRIFCSLSDKYCQYFIYFDFFPMIFLISIFCIFQLFHSNFS